MYKLFQNDKLPLVESLYRLQEFSTQANSGASANAANALGGSSTGSNGEANGFSGRDEASANAANADNALGGSSTGLNGGAQSPDTYPKPDTHGDRDADESEESSDMDPDSPPSKKRKRKCKGKSDSVSVENYTPKMKEKYATKKKLNETYAKRSATLKSKVTFLVTKFMF